MATQRYTFGFNRLMPMYVPEEAHRHHVNLPVGTYAAGLVLGLYTASTRQNETQTLTITATGGTYTITFNGSTTGNLAYNADAATIKAALAALASVGGAANIDVTGAGPYVIEFKGTLGYRDQPLATTGGAPTGGTAVIAETQKGNPGGGMTANAYATGGSGGLEVAKCILEYDTEVTPEGLHKWGGSEHGQGHESAPAYFSGTFAAADLTGLDADGLAEMQGKYISPAIVRIP